MSATIPTQEPSKFTAGDTVKWTKALSEYPPATWTLSYSFVKSGAQFTETSSAASGTDHLVTITAADSVDFTAGIYSWQAYVTDGTDRYQVGTGTCEVVANFETATTGYDARDHTKIVIDAIEAVIQGTATTDQAAMSISGRSLSRRSLEELYKMLQVYRAEYRRIIAGERIANGLGSGRRIVTRLK